MNICRSQFGWQCAQLKKKRMRSVGPGLTPCRVGSAVAGSAVVGSLRRNSKLSIRQTWILIAKRFGSASNYRRQEHSMNAASIGLTLKTKLVV